MLPFTDTAPEPILASEAQRIAVEFRRKFGADAAAAARSTVEALEEHDLPKRARVYLEVAAILQTQDRRSAEAAGDGPPPFPENGGPVRSGTDRTARPRATAGSGASVPGRIGS